MDFLLYSGTGTLIAYVAFRVLLVYPYRFMDLLVLVIVLSLGMKSTVDVLWDFGERGYIRNRTDPETSLGPLIQLCLLTASVLLVGGAYGLRNCKLLGLDGAFARMLTVFSGMLILPAAAGVFTFPVIVLKDALSPGGVSDNTGEIILLWFGSTFVTVINIVHFIKTMTLKAEIAAQEKMP
jgi:hypothetical protein